MQNCQRGFRCRSDHNGARKDRREMIMIKKMSIQLFLKKTRKTSEIHSSTPQEHQKRENDNVSVTIENKTRSYFNAIEKQFMKVEDHVIRPAYPELTI